MDLNLFIQNCGRALALAAMLAGTAVFVPGCGDSGPTKPSDGPYTLATGANPIEGGAVHRNPTQTSYAAGVGVYVRAEAAEGYKFINWSGSGVAFSTWRGAAASTSDTVLVTMNADLELIANFQRITYHTLSISTNPLGGGTVSRLPDKSSYAAGERVLVKAAPAAGYKFIAWSGALNSTNDTVTVAMNTNLALTANFQRLPDLTDLTDSRDGKTYKTVYIGVNAWMAQNLDYAPPSGNSWCYGGNADNCNTYGRLYDWAAAMSINESYNNTVWRGSDVKHQGVCPSGWHLPSSQEMDALIDYTGRSSETLKSKGWGGGTDDYGFAALPGGYVANIGNPVSFFAIGEEGGWWTATEVPFSDVQYTPDEFVETLFLRRGSATLSLQSQSKDNGYSVRCVQN